MMIHHGEILGHSLQQIHPHPICTDEPVLSDTVDVKSFWRSANAHLREIRRGVSPIPINARRPNA